MPRLKLLLLAGMLCGAFMLSLLPTPVIQAQGPIVNQASDYDDPADSPPQPVALRSSPVAPQAASDNYFVADDGPYLDDYLFSEDVPNGRLPFDIAIDRYYSPLITPASVDSNGFLQSSVRRQLVEKKLLPEQAVLTMQIYDVDHENTVCPEVDHIYVNGHQLKSPNGAIAALSSGNNTWSTWSIPIPIEVLKFPTAPGTNNQRPVAKQQRIEIDLNVLNCMNNAVPPSSAWAIQVDWGSLAIASPIRPLLFAHGWTGDTTTFNNFVSLATKDGIPTAGQPDLRRGILPIEQTSPLLVSAIKAATTRFGVDKVNIFAHSKGGLVARHALHSDAVAKLVDNVVTFGSPHHGVAAWQMSVAITANCSAGNFPNANDRQNCHDAGEAIKVDPFRSFNYTGCRDVSNWWEWNAKWVDCQVAYVRQPNVKYYSLVGGWADIGGENATYPWRANAIPFPTSANVDKTFSATHVGIKENEDVYRCAVSLVEPKLYKTCTSQQTTALSAEANAEPSVEVIDAPSEEANIEPSAYTYTSADQFVVQREAALTAGNALSVVAPIDGGSRAVFTVYSASALTFTLRHPNGSTITSSSSGVTYEAQQGGGLGTGWLYQFQVPNPASGEWRMVVQSASANQASLVASVVSTTGLAVRPRVASYQPGTPMAIEAVLRQNNTALTGATFTGELIAPNGSSTTLTFVDNGSNGDATAGDGVATARVTTPTTVGHYSIRVRATKGAVTRAQQSSVAVTPQTATIGSVASASLLDTNGNGLADDLNITVNVQVNRAGHFELVGSLVDSQGRLIDTASAATRLQSGTPLATGAQRLTLRFDGNAINKMGVNGPYKLTNLVLYDQMGSSLVVDSATNLYQTISYSFASFERAALIYKSSTERLIDANANNRVDRLEITALFDVLRPSYYEWSGRLVDASGNEIGWYAGSGYLSSTSGALFVFDGSRIGRGRFVGPYTLRDVTLYSTIYTAANGLFETLYTTQVRSFSSFEDANRILLPFVRR